MFTKQRVALLTSEFLGTAILALVVLGLLNSQIGYSFFAPLGIGLALAVLVLVFGKISGPVLNPAITIGLWTVRQFSALRTVTFVLAQLLGAIAAFALYSYLKGTDTWVNNATGYRPEVLVAEVVGTAIFSFGFAVAILNRYSLEAKAVAVGGAFTVGMIVASLGAIGFLNPAVALSAQVWELGTYVLGPVLGAVIGFNVYTLLFGAATSTSVGARAFRFPGRRAAKTQTKKTATKKR